MTRTDAGKPRLTARDLEALELLEDMRALWEPEVALLLGSLSGRSDAVSATSVRTALRRWAKLGLVQVNKLYAHEPRLVWLTEEGARMAGARNWREPGMAVLRHTAEVARVRMWLEARGIAGQEVVSWMSERRWRQQHPDAIRHGAHVPDGIARTADGAEYAIEVELSDKGPGRTMEVAMRLTQSYSRVIYIVPAETQTARTVRGALEKAAQTMRSAVGEGQVHIMELPKRGQNGRSEA